MSGGYYPDSGQQYPGQQYPGQQYPGSQNPGQPYSGPPAAGHSPAYSFSSLVPVRHWARDPALRSWPVLLLIALVCVPPIALVMLNNATESTIHAVAWIFAAYFAVAWLLLLGVIVRPQHVHRSMLATVAVIGVVTQAPIAIFLESRLHAGTGSLLDIFTIGIPEELAKAIPIVAVAWIWRRNWQSQAPRDYLFLGAVSGLVFGAAEAVHYFIDVLGTLSGNVNGIVLQDLTIQYIWRFLTDPVDHACWAGITGYFIGLAITGPSRKFSLGLVGIGIAAVLHGLNDWDPINSHPAWVLVTLISVLLFLGYARAGALLPHAFASLAPAPAPASGALPAGPGHPAAPPASWPQPAPGTHPAPGASPAGQEPWWQAPPAGSRPAPQPYPPHAPPAPVRSEPVRSAPARSAPAHSAPAHSAPAHSGAAHSAASQPTVATPVPAPRRPVPPKPWWEQ